MTELINLSSYSAFIISKIYKKKFISCIQNIYNLISLKEINYIYEVNDNLYINTHLLGIITHNFFTSSLIANIVFSNIKLLIFFQTLNNFIVNLNIDIISKSNRWHENNIIQKIYNIENSITYEEKLMKKSLNIEYIKYIIQNKFQYKSKIDLIQSFVSIKRKLFFTKLNQSILGKSCIGLYMYYSNVVIIRIHLLEKKFFQVCENITNIITHFQYFNTHKKIILKIYSTKDQLINNYSQYKLGINTFLYTNKPTQILYKKLYNI